MASWIKNEILKRASRKVVHKFLKRWLEPYLKYRFTEDQISEFELTGLELHDLELDEAYMNAELLRGQPFELRFGRIGCFSIRLMEEVQILVQIKGLDLVIEITDGQTADMAETARPTPSEDLASIPEEDEHDNEEDENEEAEEETGSEQGRPASWSQDMLDFLLQRLVLDISDVSAKVVFPTTAGAKATMDVSLPSVSFKDLAQKKQLRLSAIFMRLYKGDPRMDSTANTGYLLCTDYTKPLVVSITLSQHIPSSSSSFQSVDIILP
eukprot:RCo015409